MKNYVMKLIPSKHLVKIKLSKDAYIIYHSLFGGLLGVRRGILDFIEMFKGGIDPKQSFNKKELAKYQKTILDLKKRHFLVGKGTDERSLLENKNREFEKALVAGKLITSLRFEMASFCNFRCRHCYAAKIYDWKKGAKISFPTAKRAIDGFINIIRRAGNKEGDITFWGGEPLLNWEVIKQTVEYVDKITKHSPIKILSGIVTNGSLFNDDILKVMKQHEIAATVSLDGLEKENNRFRKFIDGRGTFKTIVKGMEGLNRHGIRFWVELCINDYNFDSIERVMDFVHNEYGCNTFLIQPIYYQKSPLSFDHHSSKEKAKRFMEIYDYGIKRGIEVNSDWKFLINHAIVIRQGGSLPFCKGLFGSLYVKPSGIVTSCQGLTIPIGTVKEMEKIPQGASYRYIATRKLSRIKGCQGCGIEGFCGGGCAGKTAFYSGDIYDTSHPLFQSYYCSFRRHMFREMLKYHAKQKNFMT